MNKLTGYELHLRYVYNFYSFNELIDSDVRHDVIKIDTGCRFTLYLQEELSFYVTEVQESSNGAYVVLTHPNTDKVVVYEGETAELVYDEYFESMGDSNHNVYEGAITLEKLHAPGG